MIKGIEHIAIYSKETKALAEWYEKLFKFEPVYDNGKGNIFLKAPDGAMIEFAVANEEGRITGDKASGIRHLALAVDNFEPMVEKLRSEKVEVVSDVAISSKGVKTFFFRDPEGNILHLIYRSAPIG